MNYYLAVFKNYATFTGRARRSEYWYFILFHVLIIGVLAAIGAILGSEMGGTQIIILVMILYALGAIIPSLAVVVRRLHDIGKSGWYYFVSFIPLVGSIWLLVLLFTEGDRGDNQYGPDPKAVEIY